MPSEVSESESPPSPSTQTQPEQEISRSIQFNLPDDSSTSSDHENDSFEWGVPMNRVTIIGRVRSWGSLSKLEILLFVTTIGGLLASVCFTTLSMYDGNSKDFVFSSLVIVNSLFILFYLTHGILVEEFFELIAMSCSCALISLLFVVNFMATFEPRLHSMDMIIAIVSSVLALPTVIIASWLSWKYWTSGNLIFRIVGADMKLQRMCRILLLAQSLLAFDAQWTLISLILVFQQGFGSASSEQLVLMFFGLSLIALWLFIGYFSMRFESTYLTWVFVGTSLFQPVYILYLFVKSMLTFEDVALDLLSLSMFIAGGVCLTSHFSLIAVIASVSSNYGNGLADKVYGRSTKTKAPQDPDENVPEAEETSPLLSNSSNGDRSRSRQQRQNYSDIRDQEDPDQIYPA